MNHPLNAVLIIDKPAGLTSHDVVARVRRTLTQKSIGHLGTLDPLATGILPLVIGSFTRLAQFYLQAEKSYEGVIRFGFATDTYDAEGERVGEEQRPELKLEQLHELAAKFHGLIDQAPPPFSAKKIQGVPAYKLARKKKETPLKPVQVEIKELRIHNFSDGRAHFSARVASGTYLRSIAHEIGQLAGCGAHLESLRRTSVAEFTLADAHTLDDLERLARNVDAMGLTGENAVPPRTFEDIFVHPRTLLPQLPSVTTNDETAAKIRHGQAVNLPDLSRAPVVKVFCGQRDLIAIANRTAGSLFHPRIVLT